MQVAEGDEVTRPQERPRVVRRNLTGITRRRAPRDNRSLARVAAAEIAQVTVRGGPQQIAQVPNAQGHASFPVVTPRPTAQPAPHRSLRAPVVRRTHFTRVTTGRLNIGGISSRFSVDLEASARFPRILRITRIMPAPRDENSAITLSSDDDNMESDGQSEQPEPVAVNPTCPICLLSPLNRRPVSMMCGHLYCRSCIKRALRVKQECPICKQMASGPAFIDVFLGQ